MTSLRTLGGLSAVLFFCGISGSHAQWSPEQKDASSAQPGTPSKSSDQQTLKLISADSKLTYPPFAARRGIEARCDIDFSITPSGLTDGVSVRCSDPRFIDVAHKYVSSAKFDVSLNEPLQQSISVPFYLNPPKLGDVDGIEINTPLRERLYEKYRYIPSVDDQADYIIGDRYVSEYLYPDLSENLKRVTGPFRSSNSKTDLVRTSIRLIKTGDPYTWKLVMDGCDGRHAVYSSKQDGYGRKKESKAKKKLAKLFRKKDNVKELKDFIANKPFCTREELSNHFTAIVLNYGIKTRFKSLDPLRQTRQRGASYDLNKEFVSASFNRMYLSDTPDRDVMVENVSGEKISYRDYVFYRYLYQFEQIAHQAHSQLNFFDSEHTSTRSISPNSQRITPLHVHVETGTDPLLIERAFELGLFDPAVALDARKGAAKTLRELMLEKGGDYASLVRRLDKKLQRDDRPISLAAMRAAVAGNDTESLNRAYQRGFKFAGRFKGEPYNLLAEAVVQGRYDAIGYLTSVMDVDEQIDFLPNRPTVLHLAMPSLTDEDGSSIYQRIGDLEYSIGQAKSEKLVDTLLSQGADWNAPNGSGRTAIEDFEFRLRRKAKEIEQKNLEDARRREEVRARNQLAAAKRQERFDRLMGTVEQSRKQFSQSSRQLDNSLKPRWQQKMDDDLEALRLIKRNSNSGSTTDRSVDGEADVSRSCAEDYLSCSESEKREMAQESSPPELQPIECDRSSGASCAIAD